MIFSPLLSLLPALAYSSPTPESSSSKITKPSDIDSAQGAINIDGWPSIHDSATAARRILKLHGISTLSSVFPTSQQAADNSLNSSSFSNADLAPYADRPADIAGAPIGLMDYHASCSPSAYDPLLIGVTIATTMRNAAAGSNVTLSLRYHLPTPAHPPQAPHDDPWVYLPANLPRFSLIGYLERIDPAEVSKHKLDECFFETHPDSRLWAPGGTIEPHESWWARLKVQHIYFFGGFGDRARIGWLPLSEWQSITDEEVEAYRLPGEKGWREQQALRLQAFVDEDDGEEWDDPMFRNELK